MRADSGPGYLDRIDVETGKFDVKTAVVDGKPAEDYYVCGEGDIWTTKRNKYLKMLRTHASGKCPYPRVKLVIDGKSRTLLVHRIVCETYHEFPTPIGVKESEWKQTPRSVKKLMPFLFQVNHIDEDHTNHHPSNLEWVTARQNSHKHQELKKNKQKLKKAA